MKERERRNDGNNFFQWNQRFVSWKLLFRFSDMEIVHSLNPLWSHSYGLFSFFLWLNYNKKSLSVVCFAINLCAAWKDSLFFSLWEKLSFYAWTVQFQNIRFWNFERRHSKHNERTRECKWTLYMCLLMIRKLKKPLKIFCLVFFKGKYDKHQCYATGLKYLL